MSRRASPSRSAGRPAIELPAPGSGPEIARARTLFLVDEPVVPGAVREPILASWTRSRLWQVRPDHLDLPFEPGSDDDTILTRAAEPVLREIADLFATEPVSVILCDADGVVLSRRTGDSGLEQHLNRVWLAPGFSYAEQFVGTNGIGTALEARGPAQVFGHEHYVEHLEELACAGAPIRHPVTGKVLGVIDLTCWQRDAGPLLVATAGTLTRQHRADAAGAVGGARARRPERLPGWPAGATAARCSPLGDDLVMMNDRARELLDPADQEQLLAEASEALAEGRRHPLLIDLPSGRAARVHIRPTVSTRGVVGGVLDVQLISSPPVADDRSGPAARPPRGRPRSAPSAAWTKCCRAVDRHLLAREWLVLEGEPGSGRETVARAAHQLRTPAARLRVLAAEDAGPDWAAEVAEELASTGGSLVLTDVDRLPAAQMADADRAAGALPRVAPTPTGPGSSPPCGRRANPRRS